MAARRSLGNVLGISFKVVSMTLAELFLGAGDRSPRWMVVGGSMVAIIFMPQGAAGLRAALAQSVAVDANDR